MLTLAGENDPPEDIDPEHLAGVLEGLAQARRGEFATDAEVEHKVELIYAEVVEKLTRSFAASGDRSNDS